MWVVGPLMSAVS